MDSSYGYSGVLDQWIKRVMVFAFLVAAVFCAYSIVSAIITVKTTGVLKVTAGQNAIVSISRTNSQAKIVGEPGKAQIRLQPGTYQVVAAANNGQVAAQVVSVQKRGSTSINLTPATSPKLPSVNSISFFGTSALTKQGVSSSQIDTLKTDFFHFKTSAGAVNINQQSVQQALYNLGDPFMITFSANVDSRTYNAKITYTDLQNIRLQLYDTRSGQLVFDSTPAAAVKNLD